MKLLLWLASNQIFIYPFLAILIGVLVSIRTLNSEEKWIALTVFIYAITEIISSMLAFHHHNNLWFYNLMLFPQFILVMILLVHNMANKTIRRILFIGGACLLLFHLTNILFLQGIYSFNNFTYIPAAVWMATASNFYLRGQMEQIETAPFEKWLTWFALATLIDNAGSAPILSLLGWSDYLNSPQAMKLLEVTSYLYSFWYFIILIGFIWTRNSLRSGLRFRSSL